MLSLLCTALHPAIPALQPGVVIGLNTKSVVIPMTTKVMAVLVTAIGAKALVPAGPDGPFWDEVERQIAATRDELFARADALIQANAPVAHRQAS